ncbi:MAG: hypothetical protein VW268_14465 [Rhodospirillaceae bacterium]
MIRRRLIAAAQAGVMAGVIAIAGWPVAAQTVPCDKVYLDDLKRRIKKIEATAQAEVLKKAQRQYELAEKVYIKGKVRLCGLALKKGFEVVQENAR